MNNDAASPSSAATGRHILVAVAWPYANGESHLGHLAGAYLPSDIFARYHRILGSKVLMISGADAHGTPITVKAEAEGVGPEDIVNRYHAKFLEQWERVGISFDLFTTTMTDNHRDVTQDMFRVLHEKGFIDTKVTEQYFDPEAQRFLPDRYVEGTCPNCKYEHARGDQCDNCGKTLDPTDLLDPRSKLTGATPERRETEHYFILLSKLQDEVHEWLKTKEGWRPAVINWALGLLGDEGLLDRAITRDLSWGVPIPEGFDTIGEGKRIYVWFEAVIGYLSAAMEWAQQQGDPDAWKAWWTNPDAESYYFIGKDNIPFHALFWPAYLIGHGGLNLPTNVPANQYVTFKGAKASKSMGIGVPVLDYLERYEPDALRYALAGILPETNDTDLTEEGMVDRINNELVAAWGNLVNRVLAMTGKYFDGVVPEEGERDEVDLALLATVDRVLADEAALLEQVELRAALRTAVEGAQAANAYLSDRAPWTTAKTDMARTATTLRTALDAINGLKVAFAPFVPFSTQELHRMLAQDGNIEEHGWQRHPLVPGTTLAAPQPLYAKVELPAEDE